MDDDDDDFGGLVAVESATTEAEKEYANMLTSLRDTEGMKFFADVFTKLYDSYYERKEEITKLTENIEKMKSQADNFDKTLAGNLANIKQKEELIKKLIEERDEAKALADAMHARELISVESLETIKKTVVRLEKELDVLKRSGDEDAGATTAAKEKEKFEKEKARLQGEVDGLKQRLAFAINFQEELDAKNTELEDTIAKLTENLEEADNNAVRNNRLIEHLKNEANGLKNDILQRSQQMSQAIEKLTKCEKTVERRDKQIKELTQKMATANEDREAALAKATQFREWYEQTKRDFGQMKEDMNHVKKELKTAQDDSAKQRAEVAKLNKTVGQHMKKYQMLERSKADSDVERDRLRQQVTVMEREMMMNTKQAQSDKRTIENLNHDKETMSKALQKLQLGAQENLKMLDMADKKRKQLEYEIDMNMAQINKQRLIMRQHEKDKDRMMEEAIALNEKIDEIADAVRMRDSEILDLKKELRETMANNRKLTAAFDAMRAERNMLHKNYTDSLDEIMDLKNKLRMLAYQIEQLKEDITGKEIGLKSCQGQLLKINKKVEQLRSEIQAGVNKLSDAKADISALRQEEARLTRIIHESDAARAKLNKELEGLMNERDVIGAQLVRRNDEIALLYEKIRILEITLQRGERQYEQRLEDIRLLRLELLRLRKEKNLLAKGIENMTDLRLEVFNLERELGRERLRVRALEQALETPINVHRWRKLQGTDPDSVQLTHKLRMSQKKVLVQSEMLVIKERELKETKNLYKAVKDTLALQPSPEIKQTLNATQRALAQRTTRIKCLVAEVSMREKLVTDLRNELDRVQTELTGYKQKYFEMKRALDVDEARRLKVPTPVHSPDGGND